MASRLPDICAAYGARLQRDLALTREQVAGLLGNADVESAGFNTLQEMKPVVAGSRGGFGWMQWTGPRRRAYEAWGRATGADLSADETNYSYVVQEMKGDEKAALAALRKAATVDQAATTVCTRYLRPGVPHLDRRIASARAALGYLGGAIVVPPQVVTPVTPADPTQSFDPMRPPAAMVRRGSWPETDLTSFEVKAIQQRLLDLGFHVVGFADGKWGERTAAAVAALQENARTALQRAEIVVDGHYGPQTRELLANDASRATVAPERANVTAKDLAAVGNPGVKTGRAITFSSVVSLLPLIGAFITALTTNWTASPAIPWPFSMVLNVLPPWAMIGVVIAFNVYNALKASGLISASVQRVREGIDNTGAPQQGSVQLPFGLDRLFAR